MRVHEVSWCLKEAPIHPFLNSHGHILPNQTRHEKTSQRQMERNRPVGVVETDGHVASRRLNNEKDGRKLRSPLYATAVSRPGFSCSDDVVHDWERYDADEHAVEPLHKDLEHRVAMVLSARINLIWIFSPIGSLVFL